MARLTNHGRKKTHFLRTIQTLTRVKKVGLSGCVKASVWQAACAVLNDSQCAFKFKLSKEGGNVHHAGIKSIGTAEKLIKASLLCSSREDLRSAFQERSDAETAADNPETCVMLLQNLVGVARAE